MRLIEFFKNICHKNEAKVETVESTPVEKQLTYFFTEGTLKRITLAKSLVCGENALYYKITVPFAEEEEKFFRENRNDAANYEHVDWVVERNRPIYITAWSGSSHGMVLCEIGVTMDEEHTFTPELLSQVREKVDNIFSES